MQVSARAQGILAEFAKYQGLRSLAFDASGLIPIRLDGGIEIAIGYSPANDSLFVFGIVDPAPGAEFDPWPAFVRNQALVERRTRLSLHPDGPLVLSADAYVAALDFGRFVAMLDRFVLDLEAETAALAGRNGPPAGSSLPTASSFGEMIFFRI